MNQATPTEAKELDIEQITSKHLEDGIKTTVFYDSISEALADTDRYGSVWFRVKYSAGFVQLIED